MGIMRTAPALVAALWLCTAPGIAQSELAAIRNVYLLPMASGLDQYLANQLTVKGVFRVVTDPRKADAVFTDQIGPAFELQLRELYPHKPEAEKRAEAGEAPEETGAEAQAAAEAEAAAAEARRTREESRPLVSSFRRGKGNVFLVDVRSRHVVWSTYLPPKNYSSKQLNAAAAKIVAALQKAVSGTP